VHITRRTIRHNTGSKDRVLTGRIIHDLSGTGCITLQVFNRRIYLSCKTTLKKPVILVATLRQCTIVYMSQLKPHHWVTQDGLDLRVGHGVAQRAWLSASLPPDS